MTAQSIKEEIAKLSRIEQAEIVHFIMDMMVEEAAFEFTLELRSEIDTSYEAIESGKDKGMDHKAYREEMDRFLEEYK
ncbi:MAG: hypothetical protein H6557_00810 [Lewinellaceae bacterium]|nr:hypothetical protein [Phaeodactylibacter sp.]MCB9035140.1 hypothetical protein [Lewinellaceae bacterium]